MVWTLELTIYDCLRTAKPSRYITNTKVNSAFYSSWVGKSSSDEYRFVWLGLWRGAFTCVVWQLTLCDPIWQVAL